jgi:zinc transporter ZupT
LESFEALEVPILGLSAGAFLVVVLHDLIPHSVRTSRRENVYFRHLMWFVIGVLLMYLVANLAAAH